MKSFATFRDDITSLMTGPLEGPDSIAPALIRAVQDMPQEERHEINGVTQAFTHAAQKGLSVPDRVLPEGVGYISYRAHRLFSEMARVINAHPRLEPSVFVATTHIVTDNITNPAKIPFAIAVMDAHRKNGLPPFPKEFFSHLPSPLASAMYSLNQQTGIALQTSALDIGKLFIEFDQQPHLASHLSTPLHQWFSILSRNGLYGLIPTITAHLSPDRMLYQHLALYVADSGHHLEKPDLLIGHTNTGLPVFYDATNGVGETPAAWLHTKAKQAQTLGLKQDVVKIHAPFALAYLARELKTADPAAPFAALKASLIEADMASIFNTAKAAGALNAKRRRRLVWAAHSAADPK